MEQKDRLNETDKEEYVTPGEQRKPGIQEPSEGDSWLVFLDACLHGHDSAFWATDHYPKNCSTLPEITAMSRTELLRKTRKRIVSPAGFPHR
jgi:hypothetical protein